MSKMKQESIDTVYTHGIGCIFSECNKYLHNFNKNHFNNGSIFDGRRNNVKI